MRAAWIATVYNIDWPSKATLSKEEQLAELRSQLDFAANLGLNTIFLQIRSSGDACYTSKTEPWSLFLSGQSGVSPGYDPLASAITECHKRGMELHGWFNPFRAITSKKPMAANHVTQTHPDWIMHYGNNVWMNPGIPAVRQHVLGVVTEILDRYDLDGLHIDDYFYPYPDRFPDKSPKPFPDAATHAKYGAGKEIILWRQENINAFVRGFYQLVKQKRPHVKVGISPFGIWQPGTPAGISGILNAHTELAADARLWTREGWADYFVPQLYWKIAPPEQSFPVLLNWWLGENLQKRPIIAGISSARIISGEEKPAREAGEILEQIRLTRASAAQGHAFWSLKSLRQNADGIADKLQTGLYAKPAFGKALWPAAPWLGAAQPAPVVGKRHTSKPQITLTPNAAARWLTLQVKQPDGSWTLQTVSPAKDLVEMPLPGNIPAGNLALRWISPSGIEGPATVF